MSNIVVDEILQDIKERVDHGNTLNELPTTMITKIKSKPRIFYALSEAVKNFAADPQTAVNSLSGFISRKVYKLQEDSSYIQYNDLTSYNWPTPSYNTRIDGGLVHLILDGTVFPLTPMQNLERIERALISLQHQSESSLLYGPSHKNAVADLNSNQIYVPSSVEAYAKIIETPTPLRIKEQAYGRGTMTITGEATSGGNIDFEDGDANTVTVAVATGDSEETAAEKAVAAINNDSSFKAKAILFTDEIRFVAKTAGAAGDTTITFTDTGTTGVTVDASPLSLTAEEPTEIPIGVQHQERIAVSAYQQLVTNVAQLGTAQEQPAAQEAEED